MQSLISLVAQHGYEAVFLFIFVESLGIPVPGEGVMIAAALFAARTHRLDIVGVVATAALAAALGTAAGYLIGRFAGRPLLERYGRYVGMTAARQRLGQFLFRQYGMQLIFFGRFISFFRAFEGMLAGLNRMPWRPFAIFNLAGAIVWTSVIGGGAYSFGRAFVHTSRPIGVALLIATGAAIIAGFLYLRRAEKALQVRADAALLGAQE